MQLSKDQIEIVKKWLEDGAKLGDVQNNIEEKFNIKMTYMQVRFLVDDIGAELKSDPEPEEVPEDNTLQQEQEVQAEPSEQNLSQAEPQEEDSAGGEISVSLGNVQRPGVMAWGEVVFSDGGKAEWLVDQSGQLGLVPSVEGYNPPSSDYPVVQQKLQALLSKMY